MQYTDPSTKINTQKNKIQSGSPKIEIIAPCILNDGIITLNEFEQKRLIDLFVDSDCEVLFFIPASGSGSRMFDFLVSSDSDEYFEKDPKVQEFIKNIEDFAFFNEEIKEFYFKWKEGEINSKKLVALILDNNGQGFLDSPKALIPFHKVKEGPLSAFQEHLLQGVKLDASKVKFHFTIQHTLKERFQASLEILKSYFQSDYDVEFSFQNSETDSYAFDSSLTPIEKENGQFVQRPAGHGALLENLIELNDRFVCIKNIDNVQHLHTSEKSIEIWKGLCGMLIEVKSKLKGIYLSPSLEDLLEFNKTYQLFSSDQLKVEDNEKIRELVNRPLRICGMVHNEGKAGGGPFFVKDSSGFITKQIIEAVQISNEPSQQAQLDLSTHFNPVMMVLDLFDFNDLKYDLKQFRNDDNYFVVKKKYQGKDISFIELPGLWNGAMYNWNTLFLEIPIETFTPVKTVLDLLGPNHCPKQ